MRRFQSARGPDGRLHVWVGRRKGPGRGEGSSSLEFDTHRSRRIVGRSGIRRGRDSMSGPRAVVALVASVLAAVMAAPAWAGGDHGDEARHSLRAPVTDENFYFVMADRFENGDTGNDLGGLAGDRLVSGFDPTAQGLLPRRRPRRACCERIDYIKGLGTTAIWLTPSFKNKAVQLEDGPVGRLPRLLDHRLHADRPAPRHQRRPARARRRRPRARDEGLLRHHHQPHGRRHRLRGGRPAGRTSPRTPSRTAPPPARRSTTATTPARSTLPARSTRRRSLPVHAGAGPGRGGLKMPGLAQRRHALPQPRRHDLRRRELAVRRLLRPRRPVHREPARGRRDDRHLQDVDRATSASTASASTP